MRIAIVGYGKMGRAVEAAAAERKVEVVSRIDPFAPDADFGKIDAESLSGADVVMEFSLPDKAVDNVRAIAAQGKSIVFGTTGWHSRLQEVKAIVRESGIGLIHSTNFATGVNLFFRIVERAAELMNEFEEYDAAALELHHRQKADSPSGTAKSIESILLSKLGRKSKAVHTAFERKPEPDELHVASLRVGTVRGTHKVYFDSQADTIELSHTARSREGFATGAVRAAQWIEGRSGLYTIDDYFDDLFATVSSGER
jgi:4-hydroxy-tetrahydrodipicolinate reductase